MIPWPYLMNTWECHPLRNFYQDPLSSELRRRWLWKNKFQKNDKMNQLNLTICDRKTHLFLKHSQTISYLLAQLGMQGERQHCKTFPGSGIPRKDTRQSSRVGIFPVLICIMCVHGAFIVCVWWGGQPSAFAFNISWMPLFLWYGMSMRLIL